MLNNKSIGRKLKALREQRGWKQYEVAEKVNLSRPAICNIESGKRSLTLNTLQRFCELYAIDISYFEIETQSFEEMPDILSRLNFVFSDKNVSIEEKDKFFREISRIYLNYRG